MQCLPWQEEDSRHLRQLHQLPRPRRLPLCPAPLMKANMHEFETALVSTRQIGMTFRQCVIPKRGSMLLISVNAEFGTPEEPHNPFAGLDDSAPPTFAVDAEYTGRNWLMPRGMPLGVLDLSVYEASDHRQVSLLECSASGLARRRWLGPDTASFLSAMQAADPNIRVSTRQERT